MADSILKQVKALTDGKEVQVATEKIGGENYKIFVKKDDSGDKDPAIDTGAKTITITKKDVTLADADALKALFAEVKIGGVQGTPTIDASGQALDCSGADFTKDTVQTCEEITLSAPTSSILEQVKALADSQSVQVATEKIDDENYKIIVAKDAADVDPAIDTGAKTITITKKELSSIDVGGLKALFAEVKIGGVQGAPTIVTTGGTALDCSNADFDQSTAQTCADINLAPAPLSILEQVKALADSQSVQVATEKIGGENYKIFVKKDDSGDKDPAIDTGAKTITITKKDVTLADADALKALFAEVKIGGVQGTPTIDASGQALDCSGADFTKDTVQTCEEITLSAPTSSILEQVKALADSQSVQVATEKIDDENYKIIVAKDAADVDPAIDTGAKTITITKKELSSIDVGGLKALFAEVKIGGVQGAPTIVTTGGTALDCSNADFDQSTAQACADINLAPAPLSILDQVKALTDGNTVQVATEKIGGDDYKIVVAKAAADADPTLETGTTTITITKKDLSTLADAAALKALFAEVKIGGVQGAPTIVTTGGTALDCSNADFDQSTAQTCKEITLTSQDYIDTLKDIQKFNDDLMKNSKDLVKPLIKAIGASDGLTAASIITAIKASSDSDDTNKAAKKLFPAGTDLSSITEDNFKDAVVAQFKNFVSLNELLNQMPKDGTGVLKSSGDKFTGYKTGNVDASLTPIAQFYYDATIPVCGSRPFVSDTELTDADAKKCLEQFHTTAYTALSKDKCGQGGDLNACYKNIANDGLKALYNGGEVDDMKFDISIEYPDLIVA